MGDNTIVSKDIFGGASNEVAVEAKGATASTDKKTAVKPAAKKTAAKKSTKKTTAEAAKATKETTKDATKPETVKADTSIEKASKTTTAKAKKSTAKSEDKPKRKYTKRSEGKNVVYVQFQGQQIGYEALIKKVEEDCANQNIAAKNLELYIKPEDNACYYFAKDSNIAGKVDLY